jgi:UDP-3-O-[3-hydroxymyristoyl] glucosamine N-acyltransferase
VVSDPRLAVQRLLREMYPSATPVWGIDPTARIGKGARWVGRIALAAGAVLEAGVEAGEDCVIGAFAVVGRSSRLGARCQVGSHAMIAPDAVLGNGVVVKSGARVGGTGFGYVQGSGGAERLDHVGRCVLGDGVEVGANSTIDRGSVGDTIVGADTKIDNLVHIGHNVRIGRRCLIMAQVGIAGSTTVGDEVILAGQAGLADNLTVGNQARVAAQSGIIGDIAPGAVVSGYPARAHREVLRQAAALRRLAPLVAQLEKIAGSDPHGR